MFILRNTWTMQRIQTTTENCFMPHIFAHIIAMASLLDVLCTIYRSNRLDITLETSSMRTNIYPYFHTQFSIHRAAYSVHT